MFTLIVLLVVVATVSAKFAERYEEHFEEFKVKFGRMYDSDEEHARRKEIFRQAMNRVDHKNTINIAANGEQVFGITKFSDYTHEEFSVLLGRKNLQPKLTGEENVLAPISFGNNKNLRGLNALPTYVNWGAQGKVTPVKNQGQCGTCWAFSTAETVESQWAMNGNPVWEFSIQQIASCTTTCNGCGGGLTEDAYAYIMSNAEGLGSQYWGPYVQSMTVECSDKSCTEPCSSLVMSELRTQSSLTGPYALIKSWAYATPSCTGTCNNQNTTQLAAAVATNGPASICVDASQWNDYTGGVLSQAGCGAYSSLSIDHCVQLTGYNAGATNPYWLVRNSWATNWGENGYILLQYPLNTCGLANGATQVVLANGLQSNFTRM